VITYLIEKELIYQTIENIAYGVRIPSFLISSSLDLTSKGEA